MISTVVFGNFIQDGQEESLEMKLVGPPTPGVIQLRSTERVEPVAAEGFAGSMGCAFMSQGWMSLRSMLVTHEIRILTKVLWGAVLYVFADNL